jgi:hypothetical protein
VEWTCRMYFLVPLFPRPDIVLFWSLAILEVRVGFSDACSRL